MSTSEVPTAISLCQIVIATMAHGYDINNNLFRSVTAHQNNFLKSLFFKTRLIVRILK